MQPPVNSTQINEDRCIQESAVSDYVAHLRNQEYKPGLITGGRTVSGSIVRNPRTMLNRCACWPALAVTDRGVRDGRRSSAGPGRPPRRDAADPAGRLLGSRSRASVRSPDSGSIFGATARRGNRGGGHALEPNRQLSRHTRLGIARVSAPCWLDIRQLGRFPPQQTH